ncbi:hypothetical protein F5882DRAFT_417170, partial [Hyaloscypha sp. PMI_1271]
MQLSEVCSAVSGALMTGAGPSGSWRGWPITIQDRLPRPPPWCPKKFGPALHQLLSLNGMFHRKCLWVVRFFWNSSHFLRVRHGLRLAPRGESGDSSHSLLLLPLLPLQIAAFSLTLRIVLYMEKFPGSWEVVTVILVNLLYFY